MQRILIMVLLLVGGCTPSYEIREVTDQFSDPGKPVTFMTRGNLIQIGIGTFVPWQDEMNAYVDRDRQTGKVVDVGFIVGIGASLGSHMMIMRGDELTFIADSERISVSAASGRIGYGLDIGVYSVTIEQFKKIAYANALEFKIQGRRSSRSYPERNFNLLESFRENLRRFYTEQIHPFV